MFDLSENTTEFACETCGKLHEVTLKEVVQGNVIKCSCGTEIQLVDNNGSVQEGIAKINAGFKKLEDTIKKINSRLG